jgi:hypothetical protein
LKEREVTDKGVRDSPKAPAGQYRRRVKFWLLAIVMVIPLLSAILGLPLWFTLLLLVAGAALLAFSPHFKEKHHPDPKKAWAQLMSAYVKLKSAYAAWRESPNDVQAAKRFSQFRDECVSLINSRPQSEWGANAGYLAKLKREIAEMAVAASSKGEGPGPAPGEEIEKLRELMRKGLLMDNEFQAFSERFKVMTVERARGVLDAMAKLDFQVREEVMTKADYHMAIWKLLEKVDRGE